MRICVLTQPLYTNYGGLLQAYALQAVLKRMGHDVWTEDRKYAYSLKGRVSLFIRRILSPVRKVYYPTDKQNKIITRHTRTFIRKYINTTEPVSSKTKEMFKKYAFDAYIVGSDQVWRPSYSYYLFNYFLDFTVGRNVKRIAYAASFGTSEWEFTFEETQQCSVLAKNFDAISVREDSGIELCGKYLGVNAIHVLDPTMLLEKDDYIRLVEEERIPTTGNRLMTYILDKTDEKNEIIQKISEYFVLEPNVIMPEKYFHQVGAKEINKCIFPPVADWLRGFMDAKYVVTDSFHGMVFSIIFNKQFIVIANKERGLDRFTSLLKMFGLKNRLVYSLEQITNELLHTSIDYRIVNQMWLTERKKAMDFLSHSLNS